MDEITTIVKDAYTDKCTCEKCGGIIRDEDYDYCPWCGREIGERFDPETEA